MATTLTHYVYMIINTVNEKFYMGKHSSKNPEKDKYYGSGTAIEVAIKKHGKQNFDKLIISFHESSEAAYAEEARIVTEEFLIKYKDTCYNRQVGGEGFDSGTMTVINKDGVTMRLYSDDPRVVSGEFWSITKGKVTVENIETGEWIVLDADHPKINIKYFTKCREGFCWVKDNNDNRLQVKKDDPRIGVELFYVNQRGHMNAFDSDGNLHRIRTDDPRYGVSLFAFSQGKVLIKDPNTQINTWIDKFDPRYEKYLSGEILHGNAGIVKEKNTTCPHCGIVCDGANATKWHFDYCLENPNALPRPIADKVHCDQCKQFVSPQQYAQHHGDYCLENSNRIPKKKKNKYRTHIITCPTCGKQGKQPNVMENHINNCKG